MSISQTGVISPDGRYVYVTRVRLLGGDWKQVAALGADKVSIPKAIVSELGPQAAKALADATSRKIEAQSAKEESDAQKKIEDLTSKLKDRDKQIADLSATGGKPAADQAKTGLLQQRVRNDNGVATYQPMRGNFDVAYLPDFEEQYAVVAKAGLGNAQVAVNMGQGWSLQGLDALTDNSELNRRIFALIDEATALGKAAAGAALGLPPGAMGLIAPQSGTELKANEPGTPVTLRLIVVHYAAKGVYPVIKPRELQARIVSGGASTLYALNLAATGTTAQPAALYSPAELAKSQGEIDESVRSLTLPKYPYQFVSFNTFKYVSVEALSGSNPIGALYDKTGTAGDPGDRQAADLQDVLRMFAGAAPRPTNLANLGQELAGAQDDLIQKINTLCPPANAPEDCRRYALESLTLSLNEPSKTISTQVKLKSTPDGVTDHSKFLRYVKERVRLRFETYTDIKISDPTIQP